MFSFQYKRSLHRLIPFLLLCLLLSFWLFIGQNKQTQEALAARLAPKVLRFHVLASSDSPADQALKLKVRSLLLDTIYQDLASDDPLAVPLSKAELLRYVNQNQDRLKKTAEDFMKQEGFSYAADIQIEDCYFPTRQYGDLVFPCGRYQAVRVLLGNGKGHNWWCVLYPSLCYSGSDSITVMPDSSKQELQNLLSEEDYLALKGKRHIVFGERSLPEHQNDASVLTVQVKLRFVERLRKLLP